MPFELYLFYRAQISVESKEPWISLFYFEANVSLKAKLHFLTKLSFLFKFFLVALLSTIAKKCLYSTYSL